MIYREVFESSNFCSFFLKLLFKKRNFKGGISKVVFAWHALTFKAFISEIFTENKLNLQLIFIEQA